MKSSKQVQDWLIAWGGMVTRRVVVDHVLFVVADLDASRALYTAALAPPAMRNFMFRTTASVMGGGTGRLLDLPRAARDHGGACCVLRTIGGRLSKRRALKWSRPSPESDGGSPPVLSWEASAGYARDRLDMATLAAARCRSPVKAPLPGSASPSRTRASTS
jgi:hypothetical protein